MRQDVRLDSHTSFESGPLITIILVVSVTHISRTNNWKVHVHFRGSWFQIMRFKWHILCVVELSKVAKKCFAIFVTFCRTGRDAEPFELHTISQSIMHMEIKKYRCNLSKIYKLTFENIGLLKIAKFKSVRKHKNQEI